MQGLGKSSALSRVLGGIPDLLETSVIEHEPEDDDRYRRFQEKYHDHPDQFIVDCFDWKDGQGPAPYQLEIARKLFKYRRIAVRGPHGLGKSALASWLVLWFALTRDGEDWKIPTTASAWRQLTKYLWPEIRKWSRRLKWDLIGRKKFADNREMFTLNLRLETGEAFAVATNDSESIEGAHASSSRKGRGGIFYIFDEAKVIPEATWDSAEGAFSTDDGNTFWLAISTPGEPRGRFYDIHQRKPGYRDWNVRHVTLLEAIASGRISRDWAENRKIQWRGDARYINRVEGNFAASESDSIIPLSWVEEANERWYAQEDRQRNSPDPMKRLGADIARYGDDTTVFSKVFGDYFVRIEKHTKTETTENAGTLIAYLRKHPECFCMIDVIGVGAGVYDMVKDAIGESRVAAFNSSVKTDFRDTSGQWGFVDTRSAAWWNMRELLDPKNGHLVALPPDENLTGDLTAPSWKVAGNGKIRVESKDSIRSRIGKSTDEGDAVVIAFWNEGAEEYGMEFA